MKRIVNGKEVEYVVAKYDLASGVVVDTSLDMFEPQNGCGICITVGFNVGDEELNLITVQEVDTETLELTSAVMVMAPLSSTFLLRENKMLKQQVELMQKALDELLLGGV